MRYSYWDCEKKKLIHKTIKTDKIPDDEKKRILTEWKIKMIMERGTGIIPDNLKEEDEKPEIIEPIIEPIIEENNNIDNTINYTPFNLKLKPVTESGSSTIIFGASQSGKTTLLKDILNNYYNDNNFIIFMMAENIHANIYKDLDKHIIKLDKFDPTLIKTLHRINKKTNNKYQFLIVLDDIIMSKYNPLLLKLILTYRNAKISTILLLQSPTLLSKNGRFNGNNFIFKRTNNAENAEQLMDFFLGGFEPFYKLKKEEKIKLYKQLTDNYGFLYLDALNDKLTFHK